MQSLSLEYYLLLLPVLLLENFLYCYGRCFVGLRVILIYVVKLEITAYVVYLSELQFGAIPDQREFLHFCICHSRFSLILGENLYIIWTFSLGYGLALFSLNSIWIVPIHGTVDNLYDFVWRNMASK